MPSNDLTHQVKDGDSFYSIALHYYRDGSKFPVIQEANPTVDPRNLTLDTTLVIPHPDRVLGAGRQGSRRSPAQIPSSGESYVVKDGDSLWKISERTLGRGSDFQKILDANRDVLSGNGDDLQAGMTLVIPR